ncbi:hypothetical protein Trydic_g12002, partial [Trypoxylus dichotomus]
MPRTRQIKCRNITAMPPGRTKLLGSRHSLTTAGIFMKTVPETIKIESNSISLQAPPTLKLL